MPWTVDANGKAKYVVSAYTKEDLPTWNEIYNVFYKKKRFTYIPEVDTEEQDPYWKLPLNEVIIAMMANQFNKMLIEDGHMQGLVDYMNETFQQEPKIKEIYWFVTPIHDNDPTSDPGYLTKVACLPVDPELDDTMFDMHNGVRIPVIYNLPHPDGDPNPFIVNDLLRYDINKLTNQEHVAMLALMPCYTLDINDQKDVTPYDIPWDKFLQTAIEYMVRPAMTYFEGKGVGWKDENGNIIVDTNH